MCETIRFKNIFHPYIFFFSLINGIFKRRITYKEHNKILKIVRNKFCNNDINLIITKIILKSYTKCE